MYRIMITQLHEDTPSADNTPYDTTSKDNVTISALQSYTNLNMDNMMEVYYQSTPQDKQYPLTDVLGRSTKINAKLHVFFDGKSVTLFQLM